MRLVDIDSLKGCAIIRPTSSEEIAYIQACPGLIAHKDIPTAYDVEAVVAGLEKEKAEAKHKNDKCEADFYLGKTLAFDKAISIVRGKE